jgi:hypothetical protein
MLGGKAGSWDSISHWWGVTSLLTVLFSSFSVQKNLPLQVVEKQTLWLCSLHWTYIIWVDPPKAVFAQAPMWP